MYHINSFDISVENSYNYGIMLQDHGPHTRHINIDEGETFRKRQSPVLFWVPFSHRCEKHDVYSCLLPGNNQTQGQCIFSSLITPFLQQHAAQNATDDGGALRPPADHVNAIYRPVYGECRTEAQPSNGYLQALFVKHDKLLQWPARACQHFLNTVRQT